MTEACRTPNRQWLASLETLSRHPTAKFIFKRDGINHDGFLVFYNGQVFGYENRCRHIPITIDYGDNKFFTGDGKSLVCQTHGAMYDPITGLCFQGPCKGSSLFALRVEVESGNVYLLQDGV